MSSHKFAVGATVKFAPPRGAADSPIGATYEVTRLMPLETRGYQYRIKSRFDGHERVVTESELGS